MTLDTADYIGDFFSAPILNSPYEYPRYHWELDETGQPTGVREDGRRLRSPD